MSMYKREDLRRVVFSELSEQCDEAIIHELCVQFGPVRNVVWPTTANLSGVMQRQTFCFVDFVCSEDAQYCFEALSRSVVKLFEKEIRVGHASTELAQRGAAAAAAAAGNKSAVHGLHEVGAKVVVRNIDLLATEFDLKTFFEQFGPFAVPPRMIRDAVGNFRGTAILSYKDFSSSDKLVEEMHQRVYRDRIVSVQYAEMEDGSGRLHGTPEERANAQLIQQEEAKYLEKVAHETAEASRDSRRQRVQNTSWAEPVDVYGNRRW